MSMSQSSKGQEGDINITPMIDILLVLIIIFMVLQARSAGERVEIPQPGPPQVATPEKNIVVHLIDQGFGLRPKVKINQDEVAWEDLEARLVIALLHRPDRVAFVKGDPELEFEFVAQVVESARNAGAARVGLLRPKD
jgi:biopolymer transport protein ExbD